jgi:hypothetical protein
MKRDGGQKLIYHRQCIGTKKLLNREMRILKND